MTTLKTIPVVFNQENHTYTNIETGEMLKGITSTLVRRTNPNKYTGIPEAVLKAAAERGSAIHEEIELAETIGITPTTKEGANYLKLKDELSLYFLQSEYTVSDLKHYATNIDAIYEVEENVVDIADFKTTYKFDKDSTSWQLSICAYLLELNNPHVKVRRLLGIWLRDEKAEVIELERKTSEEIERLMQDDLEDKEVEQAEIPYMIVEKTTRLKELDAQIKLLTQEQDEIKAELLKQMVTDKAKSYDTGDVLVTYIAPSSRESFDSKKFKTEHPDIYQKYLKESKTKESLKITIR